MSNQEHGKEVASTSHSTKRQPRRPSQFTWSSQLFAFPSIGSSFRRTHFGSRPLAQRALKSNSRPNVDQSFKTSQFAPPPLVHGALNSNSNPNVNESFKTSHFAPPPLVQGVQSTNPNPTPMDGRPDLGSDQTNSKSDETSSTINATSPGSNETFVASESNYNVFKPILNLDGQGYTYTFNNLWLISILYNYYDFIHVILQILTFTPCS